MGTQDDSVCETYIIVRVLPWCPTPFWKGDCWTSNIDEAQKYSEKSANLELFSFRAMDRMLSDVVKLTPEYIHNAKLGENWFSSVECT